MSLEALPSIHSIVASSDAVELASKLRAEHLTDMAVNILENRSTINAVRKGDRGTVSKIVKVVTESLPEINPAKSKAHVRAVKKLLQPASHLKKSDSRIDYTDAERKLALFKGLTGSMSVAKVDDVLGVPRTTFYRYRNQVLDLLGSGPGHRLRHARCE